VPADGGGREWRRNDPARNTADADATEGYALTEHDRPRQIGGVVMEMKNITLRFGGVVAIKDISFDIREGEIRAIIGPNGAGKSSMLNVISGFYTRRRARSGSAASARR
jgi:branched-chain amino acid transport system ATP-binding protein